MNPVMTLFRIGATGMLAMGNLSGLLGRDSTRQPGDQCQGDPIVFSNVYGHYKSRIDYTYRNSSGWRPLDAGSARLDLKDWLGASLLWDDGNRYGDVIRVPDNGQFVPSRRTTRPPYIFLNISGIPDFIDGNDDGRWQILFKFGDTVNELGTVCATEGENQRLKYFFVSQRERGR